MGNFGAESGFFTARLDNKFNLVGSYTDDVKKACDRYLSRIDTSLYASMSPLVRAADAKESDFASDSLTQNLKAAFDSIKDGSQKRAAQSFFAEQAARSKHRLKVKATDDTSFWNKGDLEVVVPGFLTELMSELQSFRLFPNDGVMLPPGAKYMTYKGIKSHASAMLYKENMKNIPEVTLTQSEESFKQHHIISGFSHTIFESAADDFTKINTMFYKQQAAARAILELADELLFFGDDDTKLYSILNHPKIEKISSSVVISPSSDPEEVLAYFVAMLEDKVNETDEVFGDYKTVVFSRQVYTTLDGLYLPVNIMGSVLAKLRQKYPTITFTYANRMKATGPGGTDICLMLPGSGDWSTSHSATPTMLNLEDNAFSKSFAMIYTIGDLRIFYPDKFRQLFLDFEA